MWIRGTSSQPNIVESISIEAIFRVELRVQAACVNITLFSAPTEWKDLYELNYFSFVGHVLTWADRVAVPMAVVNSYGKELDMLVDLQ